MKKIGSRILNLSYSVIISLAVNYMTYAFQNAIIFSIIPMIIAISICVSHFKKSEEKIWQYFYTIPMIIISYLFYLNIYIRGKQLWVVAAVLSLVLAVWAILCLECKIAFKKETIFYVGAYILIYFAGGSFLWVYYNNAAAALIDYLIKNADIISTHNFEAFAFIENAAAETDSLCREIDMVFYASDKRYRLSVLAHGYCLYDETCRDEYYELLGKLDGSDFNKIRLLLDNVPFKVS